MLLSLVPAAAFAETGDAPAPSETPDTLVITAVPDPTSTPDPTDAPEPTATLAPTAAPDPTESPAPSDEPAVLSAEDNGIAVYAAFAKVDRGKGLYINADSFQKITSFLTRKGRRKSSAAHRECRFVYARKSSSSKDVKSSDAEDLLPSGSPSLIFWRLFKPQAIPRFPFELNA